MVFHDFFLPICSACCLRIGEIYGCPTGWSIPAWEGKRQRPASVWVKGFELLMTAGLFCSGWFGFEAVVGPCAAPWVWGQHREQEAFSTEAGFSCWVMGRASEASPSGLKAGSDPRQKLCAVLSPHFFPVWFALPSPATCARHTDVLS